MMLKPPLPLQGRGPASQRFLLWAEQWAGRALSHSTGGRVSFSLGSFWALSHQLWLRSAWYCGAAGPRASPGGQCLGCPWHCPGRWALASASVEVSLGRSPAAARLLLHLYIATEMNIYVHEIST